MLVNLLYCVMFFSNGRSVPLTTHSSSYPLDVLRIYNSSRYLHTDEDTTKKAIRKFIDISIALGLQCFCRTMNPLQLHFLFFIFVNEFMDYWETKRLSPSCKGDITWIWLLLFAHISLQFCQFLYIIVFLIFCCELSWQM